MSDEKRSCDLCGLAVDVPGFKLKTAEGDKGFCCEGCKGVYQMLHATDKLKDVDSSEDPSTE